MQVGKQDEEGKLMGTMTEQRERSENPKERDYFFPEGGCKGRGRGDSRRKMDRQCGGCGF